MDSDRGGVGEPALEMSLDPEGENSLSVVAGVVEHVEEGELRLASLKSLRLEGERVRAVPMRLRIEIGLEPAMVFVIGLVNCACLQEDRGASVKAEDLFSSPSLSREGV